MRGAPEVVASVGLDVEGERFVQDGIFCKPKEVLARGSEFE